MNEGGSKFVLIVFMLESKATHSSSDCKAASEELRACTACLIGQVGAPCGSKLLLPRDLVLNLVPGCLLLSQLSLQSSRTAGERDL